MKWKILIPTLLLTVALSVTAFAATYSGPAAIVSDLTGIAEADVNAQRAAGETYGQVAANNGVLEQFKEKMLEWKLQIIDQRVEEKTLTPEQAAELKQTITERVEACTGTPADGQRLGAGLRFGMGGGAGNGFCGGSGTNQQRLRNGSGNASGNGFRRGGR